MVLPEFEYLEPNTLEEACELQAKYGPAARPIAGGTDVVPPMKDGAIKPDYLISLNNIEGLDTLCYDEDGLHIGCLTTLFDLQQSELVHKVLPAVSQSAKYIANTQVRNRGTLVGNICNASPSCDTGCITVACNASIEIQGKDAKRTVSAEEFFVGLKKTCIVPEDGEIVTGVVFPPLAEDEHAAYLKHAVRKAMDLAIIGVAAWVKLDGDVVSDIRLALGGVAIKPIRSPRAEEFLKGKKIRENGVFDDELLNEAGILAMRECRPITDVRASAEYRKDMIRVYVKRAIKKAVEGYKEGEIS